MFISSLKSERRLLGLEVKYAHLSNLLDLRKNHLHVVFLCKLVAFALVVVICSVLVHGQLKLDGGLLLVQFISDPIEDWVLQQLPRALSEVRVELKHLTGQVSQVLVNVTQVNEVVDWGRDCLFSDVVDVALCNIVLDE